MAINTHQADHVEYIQDSDGNKHYLNAEYLDGHSYTDIKYTLPIANASDLGGVKSATTGTTANRDYKVQVNDDGTMKVNVPWTDTNTDTKVTSVANHYTPAANSSAQLSANASSTTVATWNSTSLVTGVNLQRDSKGHVTGVTVNSIKMPANPISGVNVHKGPYSADNNNDHTVYSESSESIIAHGNGNGCLIMVHGHIIYQSGYINITDTGVVYTDYDSYAIQAGEEGYWGKSWVTATAFFERGKNMYVHAKGVESIYVVCVYF